MDPHTHINTHVHTHRCIRAVVPYLIREQIYSIWSGRVRGDNVDDRRLRQFSAYADYRIRERKIVARYITLRPFLQFNRGQIVLHLAGAQFMPFTRRDLYLFFIKVRESTLFARKEKNTPRLVYRCTRL